jgi:hypothetical protein
LYPGGVNVALGDFDGDGDMEVVIAAGAGGGPRVKVWTIDNGVPSRQKAAHRREELWPGHAVPENKCSESV